MNYTYTQPRIGETRWGEQLETRSWEEPDVRFVLLGVPEDLGIRANGGIPGAAATPDAVFRALCNLQLNRWTPKGVGLWGNAAVEDLMKEGNSLDFNNLKDRDRLRELTEMVDQRVADAAHQIFKAGKIPVVLGGGHNNAYPLLAEASRAHGGAVDALNMDAHTDWRPLEGRHSGNGFTKARSTGALDRYAVWGLQEAFTPENILVDFDGDPNRTYATLESFAVRGETSARDAFHRCLGFLRPDAAFGLEVDVDAVALFPSSAVSRTGLSFESVREAVYEAAQTQRPAYLHLCEGQAIAADGKPEPGVAKALASLAVDFIRGYAHPWE